MKQKVSPKIKANFEMKMDKLFDILSCACTFTTCDDAKCKSKDKCDGIHIIRNCPKEKKIPKLELQYTKDQREKVGTKGNNQLHHLISLSL